MTKKIEKHARGNSRRRLSLQICRIMAIIQVLHYADAADASTHSREMTADRIHEIVNSCLPSPVCRRTIRRDLNSLVAMGFVAVQTQEIKRNGLLIRLRLFYIAAPRVLQQRFEELGLKTLIRREASR